MSRGRQDAGPEWCAICEQIRRELIVVCPLANRRFTREQGTFSRQWVAWLSGVSLSNIRRMLDERLPSSPDTVTRLARFLGMRVLVERVGPYPAPPTNIDELIPDLRRRNTRRLVPRIRNQIRKAPRQPPKPPRRR